MDDGFKWLCIVIVVAMIGLAAVPITLAVADSRAAAACFNAAGSNAAAIAACKQGK